MSASIGIGETKGKKMNDYIERQAAIELLHSLYPSEPIMRRNREWWEERYKTFIVVEKALEQLPFAEVEPVKRGKWIYDNQFHWYRASCSACVYMRSTDIKADNWNGWKHCPNCGARMEGAEE